MRKTRRSPRTAAAVVPRASLDKPVIIAGAIIVSLALASRLIGAGGDLWLDEVWSLRWAGRMNSLLDVFRLHHDNNHHLNTVWLYLLGPHRSALLYRLPSLLMGTASVAVAGWIGLQRDRATAVIVMIMIASAYLLVLLTSEARGYACITFFALLGFALLRSYLEQPTVRRAVLYSVCCVLGVLSQPLFANFVLSASVWTAYVSVRRHGFSGAALRPFVQSQGAGLLAFGVLYVVDLRHLTIGGGTPASSLINAYGVSFAYALAPARSASIQLLATLVAAGALVAGLQLAKKTATEDWVFFLAVTVVAPVFLMVAFRSEIVYTRYFAIGATFFLVLCGFVLASLWRTGTPGKVTTVAALAAFIAVNCASIVELAEHGRGQYTRALAYIDEHTTTPGVLVGSDHDLRVGIELEYYLASGKHAAQYIQTTAWPPKGPQWLIRHRESTDEPAPEDGLKEIADGDGNRFELVAIYPSAKLSGLHWFLYRNEGTITP